MSLLIRERVSIEFTWDSRPTAVRLNQHCAEYGGSGSWSTELMSLFEKRWVQTGPDENYSKKKVDVLLVHYQGTEPVQKILWREKGWEEKARTSKTIVNVIRQWTAKRHSGCTTAICYNKMERAGSSMSTFIVADPGRSTAIPVKPFLAKN